jgi:hypothetical protein
VVIAAAIAAGYGIIREVRQPLIVACYHDARVDADRSVLSLVDHNPIETCARLWEPGGALSSATGGQVPPLTPCLLGGGTIAVFPSLQSGDTCAELGLAPPPIASPKGDKPPESMLQETLSERFVASCVGQDKAVAIVEQELERLNLDDWRVVVVAPFDGSDACASAAYDLPRHVVQLVPLPPS